MEIKANVDEESKIRNSDIFEQIILDQQKKKPLE